MNYKISNERLNGLLERLFLEHYGKLIISKDEFNNVDFFSSEILNSDGYWSKPFEYFEIRKNLWVQDGTFYQKVCNLLSINEDLVDNYLKKYFEQNYNLSINKILKNFR